MDKLSFTQIDHWEEMYFSEVDEWNEIIPDAAFQYTGNEIKALVSNYFNNYLFQLRGVNESKDNLLFALVEFSSLNMENLDGIGATYVYSCTSEKIAKETLKEYHEHLSKIKSDGKKYITEFSNWYDSGTFILQRNDSGKEYLKRGFRQFWLDKGGDLYDKPKLNFNGDAPEEGFIDYLNKYAQQIIPILNLDSFPHSFIIAKPVSLINDDNIRKPIGNYFIHIGLREKTNTSQIINFLHLFFLTWFKNHWNIIFRKFKEDHIEKTIASGRINHFALRTNFIEKNGKIKSINDDVLTNINLFFERFFEHDISSQDNVFVKELKEKIFPQIINSLHNIKLRNKIDYSDFNSFIYKINGNLIRKYNQKKIKQFIISRLVIIAAILIFDFHFHQVREWFLKGKPVLDYIEKEDNIASDELKHYFQVARLLYIGKFNAEKDRIEIKKNLISSISLFEIEMLLSSESSFRTLLQKSTIIEQTNILQCYIERISDIKKSISSKVNK